MKGLPKNVLQKIPPVPFCFTGMGIFRVWTETVYSNGSVVFPTQGFAAYDVFNLIAAAVLLACAFASRWIAPLYGKRGIVPITGACLILSACLSFVSVPYPEFAAMLAIPAAALGGLGISLIILLWSELYGCLNPLRIGLYYSAGVILSTLILWLFKGLAFYWLWVCVCLIPVISLVCLRQAYGMLPKEDRPHMAWGSFTLPWKPIAVIGLYSFTYGLCENVFEGFLGIHSGFGAIAAALFVFLGISLRRETFKFSLVWKVALVLMVVSLLPFSLVIPGGGQLSAFFALASYTLCIIVIMVILGNLCYRYGANPLWLFGIERAVRLLTVQAGITVRGTIEASGDPLVTPLIVAGVSVVLITVATLFLMSEKQLTSQWGMVLKGAFKQNREEYLKKNRLSIKCQELSASFKLTPREEEILLLLAQGKRQADIEKDLFVSNSTVKTHVKHIYQKLDVHSRKDLYALLGIQPS